MPDTTIDTFEDARDYLEKMNIRQALDGTLETRSEQDFTEVSLLWTDPQTGLGKSIVACQYPSAEYWHLEVNGWKDKKKHRLWDYDVIADQPSLSPAELSRAFDTVAHWTQGNLSRKATYREPRTFPAPVPEV